MRNVFLVIVDCLRHDAAQTHYLFLYKNSLVFQSCWATAGATVPGVYSLLTGLLPSEHGAVRPGEYPSAPTVLDMARAAGYHTLAVTENPLTRWIGPYLPVYQSLPEGGWGEPGVGAQYIKENMPPEPWFVVYHCMRVHHPYINHPCDRKGVAIDPCDVNRSGKCSWQLAQRFHLAYGLGVHESAYLLLELYNLYQDAVFVITADHGEAFWEHWFLTHVSNRLVPELLHVPLIVADRHSNPEPRYIWHPVSIINVPEIALAAGQGKRLIPPSDFVRAEDYQQEFPATATRHRDWVGVASGDAREYYDLSTDAGMHYPSSRGPEALAPHLTIRPVVGKAASYEDDETILARLKDLGYAE